MRHRDGSFADLPLAGLCPKRSFGVNCVIIIGRNLTQQLPIVQGEEYLQVADDLDLPALLSKFQHTATTSKHEPGPFLGPKLFSIRSDFRSHLNLPQARPSLGDPGAFDVASGLADEHLHDTSRRRTELELVLNVAGGQDGSEGGEVRGQAAGEGEEREGADARRAVRMRRSGRRYLHSRRDHDLIRIDV